MLLDIVFKFSKKPDDLMCRQKHRETRTLRISRNIKQSTLGDCLTIVIKHMYFCAKCFGNLSINVYISHQEKEHKAIHSSAFVIANS